jgi:hypothetical protein
VHVVCHPRNSILQCIYNLILFCLLLAAPHFYKIVLPKNIIRLNVLIRKVPSWYAVEFIYIRKCTDYKIKNFDTLDSNAGTC